MCFCLEICCLAETNVCVCVWEWKGVKENEKGMERKVTDLAMQATLLQKAKCKNANENKCAHSTQLF